MLVPIRHICQLTLYVLVTTFTFSKVTSSDLPIDRSRNLFSDRILLGHSVTFDRTGKAKTA